MNISATLRSHTTNFDVVRNRSSVQNVMLMFGVLSSLLYIATDIVAGLRYSGYSFASQAISELAASGAPSESLVDPLFLAYDVLALTFGVGVFMAAARRNHALRITALALIAYGAVGLGAGLVDIGTHGQATFAMNQRGTGTLGSDAPHIVLTAVLVVLLLTAIGAGAYAMGRRFRIYSYATLVTVIAFGALTSSYAKQLASGQPTPGMGIVERIDVYSALLWIAVLAINLQRRAPPSNE